MANPIDLSRDPQQTQARRFRQIEEDNGYPVRLRQAGGSGAGPKGEPGANGATWFSGAGAPAGGEGANGDFYLRTSNEDVYKKVGGVWSVITNIKGEKGETGATGGTGENGKEGPAGSIENTDWKNSVRVATTANITIATALNNLDVLDGVTLATNDRVLVKNQTTKKENGIWIVGVTPTRALDADAAGELSGGTTVYVESGTVNAGRAFYIKTAGSITPGTTEHEWAPFQTVSSTVEDLKTIRGIVATTTPTIVKGAGFTLAKNTTGTVTITFSSEFSDTPSVTLGVVSGAFGRGVSISEVTKAKVKLVVFQISTQTEVEGEIHFEAVGPR